MTPQTMFETARKTINERVGEPRTLLLLDTFMDMLHARKFALVGGIPGEEEEFYEAANATHLDYIFAFRAFRHQCLCTHYWSASIEFTPVDSSLDHEIERLSRFVNRRKSYLALPDIIDVDEVEQLPGGKIHGAWIVTRPQTGSATTRLLILRGIDQKLGLSLLNNAVYDHFLE